MICWYFVKTSFLSFGILSIGILSEGILFYYHHDRPTQLFWIRIFVFTNKHLNIKDGERQSARGGANSSLGNAHKDGALFKKVLFISSGILGPNLPLVGGSNNKPFGHFTQIVGDLP